MHEDHDTGQGQLLDADEWRVLREHRHAFDAADDDRRRFRSRRRPVSGYGFSAARPRSSGCYWPRIGK
ncbi:hypothetical protein [Burkholderia sp. BCC1970]|uniref:hypothetical protein n=1 Tax=Burkholderia sp. BCC1970 TaxID=2817437 RepID=UPI002ABDDB77|nr:hypothetical protein [Burkholderia sp. BCC1970]